MKNFQSKIFIIATIFSSSLYAQNTLFIPVGNEPIINSNNNTSSVSYGLTDDEITRRVERGLANTVPISALIKWKEKQQKQNTQNFPTQSNYPKVSPTPFEQLKSVSMQPVENNNKQSNITQHSPVIIDELSKNEVELPLIDTEAQNNQNEIEILNEQSKLNQKKTKKSFFYEIKQNSNID